MKTLLEKNTLKIEEDEYKRKEIIKLRVQEQRKFRKRRQKFYVTVVTNQMSTPFKEKADSLVTGGS